MLNIIAINENPCELENLFDFSKSIEGIKLKKAFTSVQDGIRYINKFPVDVCIVDVGIPSSENINLYNKLSENVKVIFTSTQSEFAVDAFKLNAIDYLMKPFDRLRFENAITKAKKYFELKNENSENPQNDHFFIRADYRLIKINFNDILFIEGLDDYLKIHLTTLKIIVARCTLKAISERLNKNFIRVHRSFIVPIERIQSVRNKSICINENTIPIGNSYLESFYNTITLQAVAS